MTPQPLTRRRLLVRAGVTAAGVAATSRLTAMPWAPGRASAATQADWSALARSISGRLILPG